MDDGLYSLVARNTDTNEFIVLPIENENTKEKKYKVNLSSIDKLTTFFNDEKHLIERLYQNKYINFKNADIFITYRNNKEIKFLEPLYKNLNIFRYMSKETEVKLNQKNEYFIDLHDTVFTKLNDKNIRNYILNSYNINLKIKNDIRGMYNTKDLKDINEFKKSIINDLTNYKSLRDMVTEILEYSNPLKKAERLLKNEDRTRALNNEPTKKEEEFLARTMNINIPTNYEENIESSKTYEEADIYKKEGKEIRKMIDLDDIIYGLSDDEALALGIDKRKMDEYVGKAKR